MKLDPGMHIVMHLVFFGKTGVTPAHPTWEEWEVKAQGLNLADTV
jgi:hypothetical protein